MWLKWHPHMPCLFCRGLIERLIDPIKRSPVASYSLPYGLMRDKLGFHMLRTPGALGLLPTPDEAFRCALLLIQSIEVARRDISAIAHRLLLAYAVMALGQLRRRDSLLCATEQEPALVRPPTFDCRLVWFHARLSVKQCKKPPIKGICMGEREHQVLALVLLFP